MSSNRSGSRASVRLPVSPGALVRQGWPTLLVLPALVSIMATAPLVPLIVMFLGPEFGLSGGREAPWPWAPAVIMLLAFWAATALDASRLSQEFSSAILAALAVVVVLGWWALEPHWDVTPVLRNPISLVRGNGHLFVPMLLGFGAWIQGLRMALSSSGPLGPERLREAARNALIGLAVSMLLAALIGGEMGRAGTSASFVALPLLFVCSAGAIAAAEMANTRRLAVQRHIGAPGWDRWARVFGGVALLLLLVTGIGALLLGPGALDLLVSTLAAIWNVIATIIYWVMYVILYIIFYILRFIAWIINSIFGDVFTPMEMPEFAGNDVPPPDEGPLEQEEPEPWRYATLVRWIMLMIIVWIVMVVILKMSRSRAVDTEVGVMDEERSSVFSAALARKQLRDLFRRKPKPEQPRRLDLDRDPESVRESMLYLQVLAARQEVGRAPYETPRDFADRLAIEWSGVSGPLHVIRERYERARYGETEEDRRAVVEAWHRIWSARKDVVIEPLGEPG